MDQNNNNITDDRNKFDIVKFNKVFNETKNTNKLTFKKNDEDRLSILNQNIAGKPLRNMTIFDIFIGIKNTWFFILDDLLQQKFTIDTFSKDNRLFYIGITLIFFGISIYLLNFFIGESDDNEISNKDLHEKIVEKHYIYQNVQFPVNQKHFLPEDTINQSVVPVPLQQSVPQEQSVHIPSTDVDN